MSKAIGDRAAIEFAVGFYDALGAGRSIEFAHKSGCSLIRLAGITEHLTPKLLIKPEANGNVVMREQTLAGTEWHQEVADRVETPQEFLDISLQAEILKLENIRRQSEYNFELSLARAGLEAYLKAMYGKPINVNKASFKSILNKFPGIKEVEAKAIVNNKPDGGYQSFEELVELNRSNCPNVAWDIIEYLAIFE